ncbi:MAG: DUF6680 family protein [Phenylobacterium sp.]
MSSDTWAIVVATAFGPIAAVLVSFIREGRAAIRDRRLFVFRTLMATRKQIISAEHVGALNLVEVEFYGCKNIETAWRQYLSHLNTNPQSEYEQWNQVRHNLLAKMLSEMSKKLGFKYDTLDIFQGGYSPDGLAHRDAVAVGALEYIRELSVGMKTIPISILDPSTQRAKIGDDHPQP